jgi:hypothetical protein
MLPYLLPNSVALLEVDLERESVAALPLIVVSEGVFLLCFFEDVFLALLIMNSPFVFE